jgi:hypothetical protein
LLAPALVAGFGLAFPVGFAVEDAREAATLDARIQDAKGRARETLGREEWLVRCNAPDEGVLQAQWERREADMEVESLCREQWRREDSWHARLLAGVRRHTGW